jgi:hypothetical protein
MEPKQLRLGQVRARSWNRRYQSVKKLRLESNGSPPLGFLRVRAVRLLKVDRQIARSRMMYKEKNSLWRALKSYFALPLEPPSFNDGEWVSLI